MPVEQRFGILVHWGYGIGWGVFRGALGATGLSSATATTSHAAVMWGSDQVLLRGLGIAPPLTQWGSMEVAIDAWHHIVHVFATLIAFELLTGLLDQRGGRRGVQPMSVLS